MMKHQQKIGLKIGPTLVSTAVIESAIFLG
jgi:hypothetical protein